MRNHVLLFIILACTIGLNACGGGTNTANGLSNSEAARASTDAAQESSPLSDVPRIAVDTKGKKPVSVPDAEPRVGGVPLKVHFFGDESYDPDGFIIKWEWNFSSDGGWQDFTSTQGDAWHTFDKPGNRIAHLRVTDNDGRKDIESVAIEMRAGNNANPVAIASSDISSGNAPLTVTFSALGSYDPDGSIVTWEWDFDDGAEFQDFTTEEGEISHDYLIGGLYAATLRVTDDDGAASSASVDISVAAQPQWHILVVDSVGNVGSNCTLKIVDNYPAIAYYNRSNADLKYVRADDEWGLAWGAPLTVDAGNVHSPLSMTVVSGAPAISYDMGNALRFVRAQNAQGSTWGTPVVVDSGNDVGESNSLAIVDGRPAISYFHRTYGDLRYVRSADALGLSWLTPITVDSAGMVGLATSLAIINSNPAIAYYDESNHDLKYVRAANPNGSSWGTPMTLDSAGNVGRSTSLQTINGMPALSYYDQTNGLIKYVSASQLNGDTWLPSLSIASNIGFAGTSTSLAVIEGLPAVAYYEGGNGDLNLVSATDAVGSSWNVPELVDGIGIVGGYASMLVIGDYPAIAYWDYTNGDLKFAILQ